MIGTIVKSADDSSDARRTRKYKMFYSSLSQELFTKTIGISRVFCVLKFLSDSRGDHTQVIIKSDFKFGTINMIFMRCQLRHKRQMFANQYFLAKLSLSVNTCANSSTKVSDH